MKSLLKYLGASVAALVLIGSLTGNVLLYRQVKALKSDPTFVASKENDIVVAAARRLMVLPDDMPTVATVSEPEKLKGQSFFQNAKKGDKVLIFAAAKKAVLYDPVADKIVETAPLSSASETIPAADATADSATPTAEPASDVIPAVQKKSTSKSKAGTNANVNAATGTDASQ